SSVTYGVGIFRQGAEVAAAAGRFTHVYVDRQTRKPVALPEKLRGALAPLVA
ncbi:MAG: acyl-CoA thioesterase, partial [Pseudomonadota bacterium]